MKLRPELYTTIAPDDLWRFYSDAGGIFVGGGNASDPKLIPAKGFRPRDVDIVFDTLECVHFVLPNPTKGISFADNIPRLERLGITGVVWKLPAGAVLPRGLVFNVKDRDHPLLNAGTRMSLPEFSAKLRVLAQQMLPTETRIR